MLHPCLSSYCRSAAFEAKDLAGTLGRVSDQEPHLWVACLDVDRNTLLAKFVRCRRSDRRNGDRLEALAHPMFEIVLAGNLEKMDNLHRRRKQGDVNLTVGDSARGLLQWRGVIWKRIPIHRHTCHRRSPLLEPIKQRW